MLQNSTNVIVIFTLQLCIPQSLNCMHYDRAMESGDGSVNDTACNAFSTSDQKLLGILGTVVTSVSIPIILVVILLMVIFKKYVFAIQRLILYIDISILFNVINQLLQRASYSIIYTNTSYCIGLAIFGEYSAYCILLSIICALFELLLRIVFKKEGGYIEILYLFIIFIFPIGISWIPYFYDSFGAINGYCTILTSINCSSSEKGLILESVLWWIPLYTTIILSLLTYPLFYYVLKRDKRRYSGIIEVDRNIISAKTLEEVGYFKWLPLLYLILDIIPIATFIHDFIEPGRPITVLWILTGLVKGLQGGIIVVVISLDPKTLKRLTIRQLQSAFKNNVLGQESTQDYPAKRDNYTDSYEGSHKNKDDIARALN